MEHRRLRDARVQRHRRYRRRRRRRLRWLRVQPPERLCGGQGVPNPNPNSNLDPTPNTSPNPNLNPNCVAVKVPTHAYGDIRFGQIDASSLVTTNVQCTQGGLWLTLRKRQDGAPPLRRELRVAYTEAGGAPIGWRLLNLTCAAAAVAGGGGAVAGGGGAVVIALPQRCAWLRALMDTGATHGNASDEHVQFEADALGEPTPCSPMQSRLQPRAPRLQPHASMLQPYLAAAATLRTQASSRAPRPSRPRGCSYFTTAVARGRF